MTDQIPFEQALQPLDELARLVAGNGYDAQLTKLIDQTRQRFTSSLSNQATTIAKLQRQLDEATRGQEFLATLSDTAAGLIEQKDLNALLHDILSRAAQILDTEDGVVYLYNAELDVMEVKVASGAGKPWLGLQIARGSEGIVNQVWQTGEPVTVDNYSTWERRLAGIDAQGVPALLAIPLKAGGVVIGVLGLHRPDGRRFVPAAVEMARHFGQLAAVAIHNARLYTALEHESDRKEVEQALRKSEEKYRALIETTGTGYAITDESGLILEANAEYLRLSGRESAAEVEGHWSWEWTASHDLTRNQAAFATLLEVGALRNFEVDYVTPDGTSMPVEINATLLQTDEGGRVLAMVRDIRTRKNAAATLAESELRFRQLAEHVEGVFWLTDANPERLLYVSPAYERFWGRPPSTLFEDPWDWLRSIHPEDRQRVYDAISTKQMSGEYDEEYRLVQPDGAIRWVRDRSFPVTDPEGRVYRVAGLTEDITGRKAAAEALRTSEERFRQLAENIDQAFWLVDGSGVLYVSPAYERIWGRSADTFYAEPWGWIESVHPDDSERIKHAVLHHQATGAYHEEYRILRPDGTLRWIRDRAFPIFDEQGAVVRVAGLAEDITEKILQEKALQLLLDCSRVTGQAFFATLVETLATVLDVRHVLLWELSDDREGTVRQVAAWHEGKVAEEIGWKVAQIPSARAALEQLTLIRAGAQQHFPADPLVGRYRAESVLAAPLRSATGATLGLLIALDDRPLTEAGNHIALLEIFAGQTATELERQQAEAEIKKLNAELEQRVLNRTAQLAAANDALRLSEGRLRQIIDLVPHRIFAKDMTGRYMLANQAEAEYQGATVEALLGKSPVEFGFPAELAAKFLQSDLDLIQSGQTRAVHLQQLPDREGNMQVVTTTIMPFTLSGADVTAIVGISIDITEQQRIETELRQSEARQRALLAAMPDMVFRISQKGYFRDFSAPEGVGTLLPREQIIGTHVRDLSLPETAIEASLAAYERAIVTGKMQTVEYAVETPEGSQHFESRVVRSGVDEIVSIVRDITERKRSDEALRLSEQRLRQIIDLVPHLIFAKDIHGRFVLANRASADLYGTTPAELVGKTDADFLISAEEMESFRAADYEVIERNTVKVIPEERITDITGRVRVMQTIKIPFTFSGTSTPAVIGVATDITELKETEMALRESEARFRQFAEHMPFIVWMIAIDGNRFVYLNSTFEEIIGHTLADRGPRLRDWLDVIYREDVSVVLDFARQLRRLEPMQVELRIVRPEGDIRWLRVHYFPVRNEAGALALHSGIAEDITQRKAAEAEIYRLNEELEERVRQRTYELEAANRELESFSYSVSHDLRAPLRAINGFSLALVEDYGDRLDRAGLDYLERVRAGSQRMASLIDDLLTLSRVTRQEMRRVPLNLSPLAAAIAAELQATQPERQVKFTIAPDLWVTGDPNLLRIVLDNLLHNAWKYSGKHAQTHIEVGRLDQPEGAVFFVRDDGAGFAMEYVDKLFGPFQRLHREGEFEGTGVGLATVQRIIHRHGGHTWAEGEVEQGATFYFTLPDGIKPYGSNE
jgi:PAS domain S-box-containing protein